MSLRPLVRGARWSRAAFQTRYQTRYNLSISPPTTLTARRGLNTVPKCPESTCDCADTPSMPLGSSIDQKANLNGLIAAYAQQVLICTGKTDWASRIEEDNSGDNLAADLKELLGRGGMFSDVSSVVLSF